MGYKHLTREQRYTIEALLQTPMSVREIGEVIGVSIGTVSREIRRNCDMRGYHRYRWQLAQKKYERRMKARRHYLKFTDEMKRTVRRFIIYGQYSPEQICGRFRLSTYIGKPQRIPVDEISVTEVPEGILSHLIRTNGMSLGKINYGHFKSTKTGQKMFLYLTGKGSKVCFTYNGDLYVVDDWRQ